MSKVSFSEFLIFSILIYLNAILCSPTEEEIAAYMILNRNLKLSSVKVIQKILSFSSVQKKNKLPTQSLIYGSGDSKQNIY